MSQNDNSKNSDGSAVTFAAAKSDTAKEKTNAANNVTISQVMLYAGLNIDISSGYYYCTKKSSYDEIDIGDIRFSDTGSEPTEPYGCEWAKLTSSTKLGIMFGEY